MFVNELVARYRLAANDRQEPFFLSDSDVIGFLAEAEDQACIRSRLIHESADPDICRIALDTGTDHYDVHPVLFEISNARVKMEGSSQWEPLRMVSVEWLDYHRRDWRDDVGTPAFAVFNHQKLRLVPTPDRAGEVKLEGYRLPKVSMTTGSDIPEIGAAHHLHLVDWALYRAFSVPDSEFIDPQRAASAEAGFSAHFGLEPNADLRSKSREDIPQDIEPFMP